jgi:hypothetical protein
MVPMVTFPTSNKNKQICFVNFFFSNHPQEQGRSVVKEQSLVFLSVQTETKTCEEEEEEEEEEGDEQARKPKKRD